jgi:hypothetical protein
MKTKNPIHIIQVFNNSYEYGKDEKSFADRKDQYAWKKHVVSSSGYIENNIIKINTLHTKLINFNVVNLLLLIDFNTDFEEKTANDNPYIKTADSQAPFLNWNCFQFKKEDTLEVHLNWDYWTIGNPERENFKICELKIQQPVEININGKRDFSMTGRRARTFVEKNIILEYLGSIDEYELVDNQKINILKEIPENRKRINLLKELF